MILWRYEFLNTNFVRINLDKIIVGWTDNIFYLNGILDIFLMLLLGLLSAKINV